jgi:predicted RNA methylase
MSKQTLAFELSKLKVFDDAKQNLEQYSTDSETAASLLWEAQMHNWIHGKSVIDLGAGTGILGIGCLLLGAKSVTFVEIDKDSISVLKENLKYIEENFEIEGTIEIKNTDIRHLSSEEIQNADVVVQNPPFGTQEKNMDSAFLEKAMQLADKIISMHKSVTEKFIEEFSSNHSFKIYRRFKFNYPLKMTLPHHKKKIERIKVTGYLLEKD